jgi:HEAT repeat protein
MLEWTGADGLSGLLNAAKDLGDGNPALRGSAAIALGDMGLTATEAVPALTNYKALGDKDPYVRGNTAFALGNMGSAAEKKIPALTKALTDAAIALNYTQITRAISIDKSFSAYLTFRIQTGLSIKNT